MRGRCASRWCSSVTERKCWYKQTKIMCSKWKNNKEFWTWVSNFLLSVGWEKKYNIKLNYQASPFSAWINILLTVWPWSQRDHVPTIHGLHFNLLSKNEPGCFSGYFAFLFNVILGERAIIQTLQTWIWNRAGRHMKNVTKIFTKTDFFL